MYVDGSLRPRRGTTAELTGKGGRRKDGPYYISRDKTCPYFFSFGWVGN